MSEVLSSAHSSAARFSEGAAPEDLKSAAALAETDSDMKREVLAFEAPYVITKLLDAGVVDTAERAELCLRELKRYLLLSQHLRKALPMSSALVDAAWHQFVLFTREYAAFCERCLGAFCHHVPELPGATGGGDGGVSMSQFAELYAAAFGAALPDVWLDSECLGLSTRLRPARADALSVRVELERAVLLRGSAPEVVCRVSPRARAALDFLAVRRCFLIRELPGLTAEDAVALCRPLVRYGVLRVAP